MKNQILTIVLFLLGMTMLNAQPLAHSFSIAEATQLASLLTMNEQSNLDAAVSPTKIHPEANPLVGVWKADKVIYNNEGGNPDAMNLHFIKIITPTHFCAVTYKIDTGIFEHMTFIEHTII